MEWTEIYTQTDADNLLAKFMFHDACLREAHLWTDHYVNANLHMHCSGDLDSQIKMLIQQQVAQHPGLEMWFESITRFNYVPTPANYDSIILDATLLVQDGDIYWAPVGNWRPGTPGSDDETWISAKQLRWREVNWLGKQLNYGADFKD